MRILVCFKVLPNWEKVLESDWELFGPNTDISYAGSDFNCMDESALELALRIKEQAAQRGDEALCTAATVGRRPNPPMTETLFAAGFDELVVIEDARATFDPVLTASRLADFAGERSFDLIITGADSGMLGSGSVPFLLSKMLSIPAVSDTQELSLGEDGIELVQQDLMGLWLRCVSLPALVSVGNSPAVLRAVSLRTRLRAKGRTPHIIKNNESDASALPLENLIRPSGKRKCKYLSGDEVPELIGMLLTDSLPSGETAPEVAAKFHELPQGFNAISYDSSAAFPAITADYNYRRPELTVLPDTPEGRRLAAHLSVEFNTAFLSGVKLLGYKKDSAVAGKMVCASNLFWQKTLNFPAVITLSEELPSSVERLSFPKPSETASQNILWERKLEAPPEDRLTGKKIVIVCGVGAGASGCKTARELASRLDAGFGLTRPAALNGWGSTDEIIGQSGKSVSPSVCFVLGASGSRAFLAGIEDATHIIAVNTDKNALIFQGCDIGIRSDAGTLAAMLLDALEDMGVNA